MRFASVRLLTMLSWIAALSLTSCGRNHNTEPTAGAALGGSLPSGLAAFPAPSTLPREVSGPPTDLQRGAAGSLYLINWPANRISSSSGYGEFYPNWDPSAPKLSDASYATYAFPNMAGYNGRKRVHLDYNAPAPKPPAGDVFVGIANLTRDRWDWYGVNGNYDAVFTDNYSDCITSDQSELLHVCVLQLGTTAGNLNTIMIGDSYIPPPSIVTDLNSDPAQNIGPLTVNFSGYAYSYGSTLKTLDWDWDNDGVYDALNQQHASHTFDPGLYTVGLRATDAEGDSSTSTVTFTAVDPDNNGPTASFTTSDPTTGPAPLHIHFDASASSDPDGTVIGYDWDFDGDGIVDYSTPNPGADFDFAEKGTASVKLTVVDNDYAQASDTLDVHVTAGWSSTEIDSDTTIEGTYAATSRSLDVCAFGVSSDRAGVVYRDYETGNLRFARSTNDNGTAWAAPVTLASPSGDGATGYSPRLARLNSGAPIAIYGENQGAGDWTQYAISATDATATSWNNKVNVATGLGYDSDVAVINTLPAIAARGNMPTFNIPYIGYILCTEPTGTIWSPQNTAVPANGGDFPSEIQLSTCGSGPFKHPAIGYSYSTSPSAYKMGYVYATDLDGTAWSTPNIFGTQGVLPCLSTVDGNPAWVTGLPSYIWPGVGLSYRRATDGNGTAWASRVDIGSGGEGELVVWNGKPAVVFTDQVQAVQLAVAKDADGTAWNPPYIVDKLPTINVARGTIVNGHLVIIYTNYVSGGGGTLRAAYWN